MSASKKFRSAVPSIRIIPLDGLPEVVPGDELVQLLVAATRRQRVRVGKGDIFIITHKIVSKAEGRIVPLDSIKPSKQAARWASKYNKDPRLIELVFREASGIVLMKRGVIVAETRHGFVCANAGVDVSNSPDGTAVLLPKNPDRSARQLHDGLTRAFGVRVGIVISDTFGRPWREGLVNVALGVAGIASLLDYRGKTDASGKTLNATLIAVADELASAAELVMGKFERVPAAIVRGFAADGAFQSGADLIRPREKDLFR
jgi:coenzyme F420-0:L-glutamate ligase/coenzyme F420-1:gamma-L-glutamate ligase